MASILVVEDDPTLRHLLLDALDGASHHTVLALESVEAALDALATYAPDLVVADVNLPDGSGLDLVRGIRTKFGDRIGVIVTSGLALSPSEAVRSGADLFVQKPFMTGDLVDKCDLLLRDGVSVDRELRGQA